MIKENCWIWFKGSDDQKGFWKEGFFCTKDEGIGLLIENPGFVPCRLPEWRGRTEEPSDINQGPNIPEGDIWKLT